MSNTKTEWVRFRCPEELKKELAHMVVDEGVDEGDVIIRLLNDAIEREAKLKRKAG